MKVNLREQRGFTLIELVVVMVILALLSAIAVPKFLDLQKQAEAASVQKVIGNLRSALSLRTAREIVNSGDFTNVTPNGIMHDLLSDKPEAFLATVQAANPATPVKGSWYDLQGGGANGNDVVYVLKNTDIVSANNNGRLHYSIVQVLEDTDGDGTDEIVGLTLQPRNPAAFDWNY